MTDITLSNKVHMVETTFDSTKLMEYKRLAPVMQKVKPTRKERRAKERKLKKRLALGLPLHKPDNRYKKLSDEAITYYKNLFTEQLLSALRTCKAGFTFAYPRLPEFDEILSELPNSVLGQIDDCTWYCMLPVNDMQSNLNFQIKRAHEAQTELCIVNAKGVDIDAIARANACIEHVIKTDIAQDMYAFILFSSLYKEVHKAYNDGESRVDMLLAIDAIQKKQAKTVVYDLNMANELADKYDCIESIDVEACQDKSYKLTFKYKHEEVDCSD